MKKNLNLILFVFNVLITLPFLVINNLVPITFFEGGIFFIIWNIIVLTTFIYVLSDTIIKKGTNWTGRILLILTGLLILAFLLYWGFNLYINGVFTNFGL